MEGTPAPGDAADLGEVQQHIRRGERCVVLIKTSASKASQRIENRERRAEERKERLRAEYEALVDEAVTKEEARDSQLRSDLCTRKMQVDQQIKELERQKTDLTREIQQLRDRMRQDATTNKARPDLKGPYMQRVQEVDEDLVRFKAACNTAHMKYKDEILRNYMHGRGRTPDMMFPDEPSTGSDAEPEGADDAIHMPEGPAADYARNANQNAAPDSGQRGHDVQQPQLNPDQDGAACPDDNEEGATSRDNSDATAGAEKRNHSGTPTGAENGSDQDARGPRKRARHNLALQTIDYDDVYQDGNPEHIYQIVYFTPPLKSQSCIEPGWFIIRCRIHGLHFGSNGRNALASAAKHISGGDHGHMQKTYTKVIETLGWRILNCDATKADRNNAMLPRVRDPEPRMYNAHHEKNITQPEVGKPYIIRDEGRAWVVMVLPLGGYFADLGVQGHFDDDLSHNPPRCFKRGPDGKPVFVDDTLQWADGYQDGQPRAHERKYPVRFFNKPENGPAWVKWVRVKELKPCNLDDPKTHKISGSLVGRTHYSVLPRRREEAWSYINGRADVPEPERELPTNAPTPYIEDEDDLQAAKWDSESYDEDSASDWEMTGEGRTVSATQSLTRDAARHPDASQIDGQQNNFGPTTSTAEGSNLPYGRAPSAPIPSPSEPNQVGADNRYLRFSSPGPVNDRMSPQHVQPDGNLDDPSAPTLPDWEEISLTDEPSLSCSQEPMRRATLRELYEMLDLAHVDPGPVTSMQLPAWTQPTGSNASTGLPAGAGQMMQQWGKPAPEADMSTTAISPPPATVAAQQTRQPIRDSGTDDLGRFTAEVIEVHGTLARGDW